MLTQEELKQLLHYDSDTGIFTWLVGRGNRKKGSIAGCLDKGYIRIVINKKKYLAHRLSWLYITGKWPIKFIDHRDTNPANNKWDNLREASNSQNLMNRGKTKTSVSGFKGVYYRKDRKKWVAQIHINKKSRYFGLFSTPEKAYEAYKKAAKELHGEFLHSSIKD